jgi:FAD:protein FMN transferase
MNRLVASLGIVALLCISSVTDRWAWAEPLRIAGATMGTTYHVKLASVPADVDVQQLRQAVADAVNDVDARMSTYRPDSEVCRFNRAPADAWFAVSAETAEVVAAALEVSEQTGGGLDVTVGPLVRLWHFGPHDSSLHAESSPLVPPTDEMLARVRTHVGYQFLEVRRNPPALRKQVGELEIDLSAVAKGHAVDRVAAAVARHGIADYVVEIGGEVRAGGHRADGGPWKIGIERPLVDRVELEFSIPLVDVALATSGNYRNFFEYAGHRYSHIIDPATERPVEHALVSASVAADTCMLADAWATALFVLGPEKGFECASDHDVAALLISMPDPHEAIRATPAWQARFGASAQRIRSAHSNDETRGN